MALCCIVQISSVSFGFCSLGGVDVAREAAQPAEMTKNAARRTPNNFFMSAPFRSNPAHPRFSEEFTARRRWIEVKELFEDSFRSEKREESSDAPFLFLFPAPCSALPLQFHFRFRS